MFDDQHEDTKLTSRPSSKRSGADWPEPPEPEWPDSPFDDGQEVTAFFFALHKQMLDLTVSAHERGKLSRRGAKLADRASAIMTELYYEMGGKGAAWRKYVRDRDLRWDWEEGKPLKKRKRTAKRSKAKPRKVRGSNSGAPNSPSITSMM